MAKRRRTKKKKIKRTVTEGIIHIHATFNNTIVTITDRQGITMPGASEEPKELRVKRKEPLLLLN